MPVDLHQMISEIGIRNTIYTVNLYLLDAIERIRTMQNEQFLRENPEALLAVHIFGNQTQVGTA